jgi:DUF1680 family protein
MDDFIALIGRAQRPDGYIYTYNQIDFPDTRWTNLQVEHELYCHGHLIEAGVSHYEATGRSDLLEIARRAADRIVADFKGKGPASTPGHQEIEIALLRLYQLTAQADYLDLARQFVEQRGRGRGFWLSILRQNASVEQRKKRVGKQRQEHMAAHPECTPFQVPAGNEAKKPWNVTLRWMLSALTGTYFQQHAPVRSQTVPVGHSVRFAYKAQYSDLFEWQLYNAAGVGMGAEGTTYLYNNPLTCRGGVTRRAWYEVPCCPSNISRTWADLGKYLYTNDERNVWVQQYVNSEAVLEECAAVNLETETELPWQGTVRIEVTPHDTQEFCLHVRLPSWAKDTSLRINTERQDLSTADLPDGKQTASGYDPRASRFYGIQRIWAPGDVVEIDFNTDIQLRRAHPKVKEHKGKVVITAGPLVYCLESVDNHGVDIFDIQIDPASLAEHFDPDLLGGTSVITAKSADSTPLVFIPYCLWGNRGPSQMTVWVRA